MLFARKRFEHFDGVFFIFGLSENPAVKNHNGIGAYYRIKGKFRGNISCFKNSKKFRQLFCLNSVRRGFFCRGRHNAEIF